MIVLSGVHSLEKLTEISDYYCGRRIALFTGRDSFRASSAQGRLEIVFGQENVLRISEFSTNPKIEDALECRALAKTFGADVLVAVGGGSVMDMAKLVKALWSATDTCSLDIVKGMCAVPEATVPIIAIPTTAGSGSEATHFAVAYVGGKKFSVAAPTLLPDAVVLDASLCTSATEYQRACNLLDALAQAIESAWAVNSSEKSRFYSYEALTKLWRNVAEVKNYSPSISGLQEILEGAHLAGKAINIAKTTAPHAWSYGFTSNCNIPHGHAVWLTLPAIFQLIEEVDECEVKDDRGVRHLRRTVGLLKRLLCLNDNQPTKEQLRCFLDDINVEWRFDSLGIDRGQLKIIEDGVNVERINNHPTDIWSKTSLIFNS